LARSKAELINIGVVPNGTAPARMMQCGSPGRWRPGTPVLTAQVSTAILLMNINVD
jgi:hypothetical protein